MIDPKRTIQIGIHGAQKFAHGWDYSREPGMRVLFMHEAKEISQDAVIAEAHHVVGTGPVYLSFDIDALDPAHANGTRIPKVGGFTHQQAAAGPSWPSRTGLCRRRFRPGPATFQPRPSDSPHGRDLNV